MDFKGNRGDLLTAFKYIPHLLVLFPNIILRQLLTSMTIKKFEKWRNMKRIIIHKGKNLKQKLKMS